MNLQVQLKPSLEDELDRLGDELDYLQAMVLPRWAYLKEEWDALHRERLLLLNKIEQVKQQIRREEIHYVAAESAEGL